MNDFGYFESLMENFKQVNETQEENIKVVCLDGEAVFKKNEDLQTRVYDSTNHAFKNRNII